MNPHKRRTDKPVVLVTGAARGIGLAIGQRLAKDGYSASKAGITALSRVLAGEAANEGITVNCVAPGRVESEMTKAVRLCREVERVRLGEPMLD
jgi:NAD(P)-dependent dehydrogenase (short-subunit alcohol dehydrogenase family)